MLTATYVKDLEGWRGEAKLYNISEGITYDEDKHTNYIVISAVERFEYLYIHETCIFPSDLDGNILDWGELPGSQKNTTDHDLVLSNFLEHYNAG